MNDGPTTSTGSTWNASRDDYCYRHADRLSFVLCQRCTRTVCPECQTPAPVGVLCPDCMAGREPGQSAGGGRLRSLFGGKDSSDSSSTGLEPDEDGGFSEFLPPVGRPTSSRFLEASGPKPKQQRTSRRSRPRSGSWFERLVGPKLAAERAYTWSMLLIGAVTIPQLLLSFVLPGDPIGDALLFRVDRVIVPWLGFELWRFLSYAFVHGGLLHFAFNLLSLWIFGRAVEEVLGGWRYWIIFIVTAIGGATAVAFLAPMHAVIGASGAVFGLMGAYLVIMRRAKLNPTALIVLVAINLGLGFFFGGSSWQAHLGGFLVGILVGWLMLRDVDNSRGKRIGSGVWLSMLLAMALIAAVQFIPLAFTGMTAV
ncbi:rhomboid family intramembrane serine protease [Pseudoclavibacter alba]|nr:rhomboid family intramembrane serine protease [Pseudoclavibacter alba]